MRKHSARKWLHFVLDLLPILVLPIFAIYEINHDHNEPIIAEVEQNKVVKFNQLLENDLVSNTNFNVSYLGDYTYNITSTITSEVSLPVQTFDNDYPLNFTLNKFVIKTLGASFNGTLTYRIYTRTEHAHTGSYFRDFSIASTDDYKMFSCSGLNDIYRISFVKFDNISNLDINLKLQIFDLTTMFGYGNEPSLNEFLSWYGASYYPYDLGSTQLLNIGTESLINTDIGSQMLYAIYKPVKDYFNFNNVFNFGDIYHWFELNMFGGNAPMPIFIVWNIIVYQFLMDLMFLVYSIFMFIIDFSSECLERCFSFSRHGGSR